MIERLTCWLNPEGHRYSWYPQPDENSERWARLRTKHPRATRYAIARGAIGYVRCRECGKTKMVTDHGLR